MSLRPGHRAVIQRAVRKLGVEVASDQILRLLAKVNEVHRAVGGTREPAALQVQATAVLVAWAIRVVRDGGQRGEFEAVAPRAATHPAQRVDPIALLKARPLVSPGKAAAQSSSPYTLYISRRGSIEMVERTSAIGRTSAARTSGVRRRTSATRLPAAPMRRVAVRASPPGSARRAGDPSSSRVAAMRRRASPPRSERANATVRSRLTPADSVRSRGLALDILRRAEHDKVAEVETAAAATSDAEEDESASSASDYLRGSPMLERDTSVSPNCVAPMWPGTGVPLSI